MSYRELSDFLILLSAHTDIAICVFPPDVVGAASLLVAATRDHPSFNPSSFKLDPCVTALSEVSDVPVATILCCHRRLQSELKSYTLPDLHAPQLSEKKRPLDLQCCESHSEQGGQFKRDWVTIDGDRCKGMRSMHGHDGFGYGLRGLRGLCGLFCYDM